MLVFLGWDVPEEAVEPLLLYRLSQSKTISVKRMDVPWADSTGGSNTLIMEVSDGASSRLDEGINR